MIIDTCSFVPTAEILRQWFAVISQNRSYMRVFWKGFAHWADLTKAEYFELLGNKQHADFVSHLAGRIGEMRASSVEDFVREKDAAGVDVSVIHNGDYGTHLGVKPLPFEYHADLARSHPGRFLLLAGIDPLKGSQSLADLDRCLDELGYRGLIVVPFRHGVGADHEVWKPLYRRCQERGAPVWIHSTTNWDPDYPIDISSPRVIDKIAIEFPDLTSMAGHAGWPWVMEMVVVAWRHPNVFLEVSAFRPGNMSDQDYGFGPLLYFGKGPIQDKITFGSTWNMLNLPLNQIFDEVRGLGASDRVTEKWLRTNAARALGVN